jgi:hypothetical protein
MPKFLAKVKWGRFSRSGVRSTTALYGVFPVLEDEGPCIFEVEEQACSIKLG